MLIQMSIDTASLPQTNTDFQEVNTSAEAAVRIHLPCVELQDTIPLEPILNSLFNPKLANGITGKFSWRLPERLDHEHHLKRVDEFLHIIKPNFDALPNNQKNALRSFLYVFSGIFGSTSLPVRAMEISMGSELTIGAGTGSSASFAVCLAGALIQLLKRKTASDSFDSFYDIGSEEFTMSEKEIISEWAYNCERIMHGTPSGEFQLSFITDTSSIRILIGNSFILNDLTILLI